MWKRIGTFLRSRFLIMILIVLLAGSLIFFQTASLQLATSTDNLIERENGIYRQLTVYAPRGILTDRYGQPVAYNVSTHVLYLANAGLEDDELNRMLLDLTDFLDVRETPYDNSLEDYLAVDPIRFTDDMSEIRYWQQSVLGLKAGVDGSGTYDDEYVKNDPVELFRYLAEKRFSMDWETENGTQRDPDDLFRVMRLRYRILTDAWAFGRGTPLLIAEGVDEETLLLLEEQSFRYMGLVAGSEYRRAYSPEVVRMAHVIGYVGAIGPEEYENLKALGYENDAVIGKAGVEAAAEQYLVGKNGERPYNIWTVDEENGTFFPETIGSEPQPGNTVRLTIDPDLQQKAMDILEDRVESSSSSSGAMVVMDAQTGEVLAMASYPTYDPRDFLLMESDEDAAERVAAYLTDTDKKPMLNRTIMEQYAPGSCFKPVMSAAGLETGTISPYTRLQCRGYIDIDGLRFRCLGSHGWLDLANALRVSCNAYFYQLGLMLGIDAIDEWAQRFGLGEYTNIDLVGEIAGMRSNPENKERTRVDEGDKIWNPADTVQSSIGQFDHAYTVIQLARYAAALGTGQLVTPHVIKEVTAYDGTVVFEGGAEPQPIDVRAETLASIRKGMLMVTDNPGGNGYRFFKGFPVKVPMKTGTAEYGVSHIDTNGILISYAPAENPKYAIAHTLAGNAGGSAIINMQYEMYQYIYQERGGDLSAEAAPEAGLR